VRDNSAATSSSGPREARQTPKGDAVYKQNGILQRLFEIDCRSLALFRIAIALILLADLGIRVCDLNAMYLDTGMFPRAEIQQRYSSVWNWSLQFASRTRPLQIALFGVEALLGMALLIGYRTRLATIGSWLLLVSIQNRVLPILNAGDGLLRQLLFWAMFLPLDRVWSLSQWLADRRGRSSPAAPAGAAFSAASAAILLQMVLLYLCSAIFKTNGDWFQGRVIAGTLAHDLYAKPLGEHLLEFPAALQILTLGMFLLEWLAPILMLFPKRTGQARLLAITGLTLMHLGIELFMTVGLFSFISIAGLTLFLPGSFWDRLSIVPFLNTAKTTLAPPQRLPRFINGLCLGLLFYVLMINTIGLFARTSGPVGWAFLNTAAGLGQKWNMFQGTPSKDGWYVAQAKLQDGSEVDLLRDGAPLSWDRPEFPAGIFPNHRWRKLFREMAYEDELGYQVFRRPVAQYLCKEWNRRSPQEKRVVEFDLIYCVSTETKSQKASSQGFLMRERLIHL
jgi:hypothetical protein